MIYWLQKHKNIFVALLFRNYLVISTKYLLSTKEYKQCCIAFKFCIPKQSRISIFFNIPRCTFHIMYFVHGIPLLLMGKLSAFQNIFRCILEERCMINDIMVERWYLTPHASCHQLKDILFIMKVASPWWANFITGNIQAWCKLIKWKLMVFLLIYNATMSTRIKHLAAHK